MIIIFRVKSTLMAEHPSAAAEKSYSLVARRYVCIVEDLFILFKEGIGIDPVGLCIPIPDDRSSKSRPRVMEGGTISACITGCHFDSGVGTTLSIR